MILAGAFALLAAFSAAAACLLVRASWPWRAPRLAILLWQALGLAWGLALIGAALSVGLAPYGRGVAPGLASLARDLAVGDPGARLDLPHVAALALALGVGGLLVAALVVSSFEVVRARHRHRTLLALVGRGDPKTPGVLVLDHPAAAAYCLPGVHAQVVVSAGTLRLLHPGELAAVLAHEHAHARERHDLVLLPFTALVRALPRPRVVREVLAAVSLLVEMRADDRARREHAARLLATALMRFSTASVTAPRGALAVAPGRADDGVDEGLVARVRRLLEPPPSLPCPARLTVLAAAAALAALPVALLTLPL